MGLPYRIACMYLKRNGALIFFRDRITRSDEAVRPHEDAFKAWLAGTEAYGPDFSDEYIAFTCLRMAAEGV